MRTIALTVFLAAGLPAAGPAAADARQDTNAGVEAANAAQLDDALAFFTAAIQSDELHGPDLATVHYDRADTWKRKGEPAKALADADQALKLVPEYGDALRLRGSLKLEQGDRPAPWPTWTRR
jgi:tetratricopeptide (TPR) repeat protein